MNDDDDEYRDYEANPILVHRKITFLVGVREQAINDVADYLAAKASESQEQKDAELLHTYANAIRDGAVSAWLKTKGK